MIEPFSLQFPPRVVFGAGSAAQLPAAAAEFGGRTLVVTGSSPNRVGGVLAGLGDHEVVRVAGEPTVDDARAAAAVGTAVGAEVVVAVGGGSVIDCAKAAAMLLGNGGDPLDYLEVVGRGLPIARPSLPLIAVPTTAGTGAEVTANAVLASPADGIKASLRSAYMVPRVALVDPELTLGCPAPITASAGMDALTQCLEPYVSNRANPVTDGWAATGLRHAGRGLRSAHADGSDLSARTDMALASLLGGLALANAKLGAVHGFAGVLGGMSPAPHGALCAALLVPVCRANLMRADRDLRHRFDQVARWITGAPDALAEDGLDWLADTVAAIGIPGLSEFGFTDREAGGVAGKAAAASSTQGNPVVLSHEELAAIYRAAL